MDEVIVVRVVEDGETTYEIRNEQNEFISDHDTLEEAVDEGLELAKVHEIEHVKIQVETEDLD